MLVISEWQRTVHGDVILLLKMLSSFALHVVVVVVTESSCHSLSPRVAH